MSDIILSRLKITGEITNETPQCVIDEIWQIHGSEQSTPIDIRAIIQSASKTISISNDEIKDCKYLEHVAFFINPFRYWDSDQLITAFTFIQQFMGPIGSGINDLKLLSREFDIGQQTPESPKSLNACVLYRLCISNGMKLQRSTSIDQMANMIKLLHTSRDNLIFKLCSEINIFDTVTLNKLLINAIGLHGLPINNQLLITRNEKSLGDHKHVNEIYEQLTDPVKLRKRISLATNNEAIILAALTYRIDISESKFPAEEWTRMNSVKSIKDYAPVDRIMNINYAINSDAYNLTKHFNPFFSEKIYGPLLQTLYLDEGYDQNDLKNHPNVYAALYSAHIMPTFYFGWHREIKNENTPINQDDVTEVHQRFLICFGVKSYELTAFTIDELSEMFKHNRSFVNPLETKERSNFPQLAINKLKKYCTHLSEDIKLSDAKRDLLNAITNVESLSTELGRKFDNIASSGKREDIKSLLDLLFQTAMYMRGWDGISIYPIETTPPNNQNKVDDNVNKMMTELHNKCNSVVIGNKFLDLPLLTYIDGKFVPADNSQGKTIGGRLKIVSEGSRSDNVHSCIRLTSNWLAATSHYYMKLNGDSPPFDVSKLRTIS